jgi:hypothetical protein
MKIGRSNGTGNETLKTGGVLTIKKLAGNGDNQLVTTYVRGSHCCND